MKVKIFDPSSSEFILGDNESSTNKLEKAINEFLATGVEVKQITQSTSNGVEVCISIWYEEKAQASTKTKKVSDKMTNAKLLATPVGEIKFAQEKSVDTRIHNIFVNANIETLEQVISKGRYYLLRYRNSGQVCLRAIEEKLAELGLSLKDE